MKGKTGFWEVLFWSIPSSSLYLRIHTNIVTWVILKCFSVTSLSLFDNIALKVNWWVGDGSLSAALWFHSREQWGVVSGSMQRRLLVSGCEGKRPEASSFIHLFQAWKSAWHMTWRIWAAPGPALSRYVKGAQRLRAFRGQFVCGVTDHSGCGPWSSSQMGRFRQELVSQNRGSWGCREKQKFCWALKRNSEIKTGKVRVYVCRELP